MTDPHQVADQLLGEVAAMERRMAVACMRPRTLSQTLQARHAQLAAQLTSQRQAVELVRAGGPATGGSSYHQRAHALSHDPAGGVPSQVHQHQQQHLELQLTERLKALRQAVDKHEQDVMLHLAAQLKASGKPLPAAPAVAPVSVPAPAPTAPSLTGNLHPPTWPQKVVSHLEGIRKLKRIEEWKNSPLRNARGEPAKILYAVAANPDHRNSWQYFPDEVSSALEDELHMLYYTKDRRIFFGLDWHVPTPFEPDGEYAVYESLALPFYLRYIFDGKHDLFRIVPRLLLIVSIIVDQLSIWKTKPPDGSSGPVGTFAQQLEALKIIEDASMEYKNLKARDTDHPPPTPEEILEVWQQLLECDICVVPSVLLMNKKHPADKWYELLRLLEREADLTVFPFIDVESAMEHKQLYLKHLINAPQYVTLEEKEKRAASGLSAQPSVSDEPSVMLQPSESDGYHYWRETTAKYLFSQGSNLMGPTIVVEASTLSRVVMCERVAFVDHLLDQLRYETEAGGWQVTEGVFIVKGCNSTRTNVLKRCHLAKEVLDVMNTAMKSGMKLCAAQPAFILQPCMTGLQWEARTFYRKGHALLTLINDQAETKQWTFVGAAKKDETHMSAFKMLDLRGTERVSQREYFLIRPQITDFSAHLLAQCEKHCGLVSESGIVRADVGIEFVPCSFASEDQVKAEQKRPADWHRTGEGFIIRCFMNEITSTLDINCQPDRVLGQKPADSARDRNA